MKKILIAVVCLAVFSCSDDPIPNPNVHINALPASVAIYAMNEDATEELLEKYTFFYTDSTLDSLWKEIRGNKLSFTGAIGNPAYDEVNDIYEYTYDAFKSGEIYADGYVGDVIRRKGNTIKNFIYQNLNCEFQSYGYPFFYFCNEFDAQDRITRISRCNRIGACGDDAIDCQYVYDDVNNRMYSSFFDGIVDCGDDLYSDTAVYVENAFSRIPVFSIPYINVGYDGRDCNGQAYLESEAFIPRAKEFLTYGMGLRGAYQYHLLLPSSEYVYPMLDKVYSGKYTLDYDYIFNSSGDVTQLLLTYKKGEMIVSQLRYVFGY